MNIQKQRNIIDLYKFAENKDNYIPQHQHNSKLQTKQQSKSQIGLSTLLHFNHNSSFSSIRSNNYQKSNLRRRNSKVIDIVSEAKIEMQQMRMRRIAMEQQWKHKKAKLHKKNLQQQIEQTSQNIQQQSITDESIVQEYTSSQMFKSKFSNRYDHQNQQDPFIRQLKIDLLKDKLNRFKYHLIKFLTLRFLSQLKKWDEIRLFKQNQIKWLKQRVFMKWKILIRTIQQRSALRQMIVQRIKQRKQKQSFDLNIENYLHDL